MKNGDPCVCLPAESGTPSTGALDSARSAAGFTDVAFEVEPGYAGWRLDRYLTAKLKHLSRARVQTIIASQVIADRVLKSSTRVHAGLRFAIRRRVHEEPETPEHVSIVHRDDWIVVVDKPAGLPVHPTARYLHGTLVHVLRRTLGESWAEPVHRLDRETSGLVVCARNPDVSRYFMRAFQRGQVHKEYLAICEGSPPEAFDVDAPLAEGGRLVRIAMRVDRASGRPSRTRFAVARRFVRDGCAFALVRAFPETGRQHQIRVHLREAGYPLVGDKIYGPDEALYDRFVRGELDDADRARLRLDRQALHAHRLELVHPGTGEPMTFAAALPADLADFIASATA